MSKMISYAHQKAPNGVRYCQLAKDPVPAWAVDIRESTEPNYQDNIKIEQVSMNEKEIREDERKKCIEIVRGFIYGPCGQYDYSYSDKNQAADSRAEDILDALTNSSGA